MKKIVVFIICATMIIVATVTVKYFNYKAEYNQIKSSNLEYESYLEKQIYVNELATIINKAVDNNEQNKVSKDDNGLYIANETNSIKIQIKILDLDDETIFDMETFYNGGIERFVNIYSAINFKCTKIEYNKKGKVSYMLFEQQNI